MNTPVQAAPEAMDWASAAGGAIPLETNTAAELTATQFLRLLADRRISVLEYVQACRERIEDLDPVLHAWHVFDPDMVEERARNQDAALAHGETMQPMQGVPVGVKDIFNTYDYPTGMGSPIMDGYTPGNDARVVSNVRLAHGIVMGKTVTAEFAVHSPGATRNPHDLARTPGTSSSGSAVAVAARMVPVALASQTAGSIIRPASYCGIYGFKPSFGLIPRTAMLKTTDTLDSVGFMARDLEDVRLMFEVCRVRGHNYPVSEAALNDLGRQKVSGRPWRIGVVRGPKSAFETEDARQAFHDALARLSGPDIELGEVQLAEAFNDAHEAHEQIYRRSLAYYFDIEWQSQADFFSPVMQDMIKAGQRIDSTTYLAALEKQRSISRAFDRLMQDWDLLIGLSTSGVAPVGLDAPDLPDHCLIWTMCGAPTLSMPLLSGANACPLGIQLVARRFNDYLLQDFAGIVAERLGS